MEKRYFAIAGKMGAGKETVGNFIKEELERLGQTAVIHHFSDPLNETLEAINRILAARGFTCRLEKSRPNQQDISTELRKVYFQELLSRGIFDRARRDGRDNQIVDGIRRPADVRMVRKLPGCVFIYVHADAQVRFERLRKRSERADEGAMTWETFLKLDNSEPEQLIEEIGKEADFRINNSGTLEELKAMVTQLLAAYQGLTNP